MAERVSIEDAVKILVETDTTNASRINKLVGQLDEMMKSTTEYREQNSNSTRNELQKMSDKIESIQELTTSY